MDDFSFLLVGTGNIAATYVQAVSKVPGLKLAGIVSRSGRKPAGAGEDLPVFRSIGEADVPFDAVILATPNGCHESGCMEAVSLGKHVFTEKTLSATAESAERMIRACEEKKLCLGVSFQRRTVPVNAALHEMFQKGVFGKVIGCELSVNYYRPQSYYSGSSYRGNLSLDGGGPFIQQASHNLDLYCWFFGLPVKVRAFTGTFVHQMEGEDYGSALLLHENGMIGTITASTASKPGYETRMMVHTEKGSFLLEGDRIVQWDVEGVPAPAGKEEVVLHSGASSHAVTVTLGHEILLRNFADCCRNGGIPIVSGREALNASELIQKIYEEAAKND